MEPNPNALPAPAAAPYDWRSAVAQLRSVKMSDTNFMLFLIQCQLAELIEIAQDQAGRLWDIADKRDKPQG